MHEVYFDLYFGTAKMAVYANNIYVYLFVNTKLIMSYNLLELTKSFDKENEGYSLIWYRMRRVNNTSSNEAKT